MVDASDHHSPVFYAAAGNLLTRPWTPVTPQTDCVPNQSPDVEDSAGVGPVYSKTQNPVPTRSET